MGLVRCLQLPASFPPILLWCPDLAWAAPEGQPNSSLEA